MSKQTINLMIAGILIIHFLTGEAFEYDDIPEYYESLSESADILDDNVQDMQGEARQILLNPKRRRERRKQRIGMYQRSGLSQFNEINSFVNSFSQPH